MKLGRGQVEDLKQYTGYSHQYIHNILNGDANEESIGYKKVTKALQIMKANREDTKAEVQKALKKIDKMFNN